jgi:RNA polymerase sigma factor (sigma-70 family)
VEGRPLDDNELVRRALAGDAGAYEELVARYQELAYRVAYVLAGDAEAARDAAQSAFIKAFFSLNRFRQDAPFRPWLLKIVANEARNQRRSTWRRSHHELQLAEGPPPVDSAQSPEGAALVREEREALLRAVNALSDKDRQVIVYRYFLDLNESEMAAIMRCPKGTVKSRLSRALSRLRAQGGFGAGDLPAKEAAHD